MSKRVKSVSKKRSSSSWAVPPVSVYQMSINHSFPESGGTVTYKSFDVINDQDDISRPTTLRIQYAASSPTTFIVYAGTSINESNVSPITWQWKVQTVTIIAASQSKVLTLRFPRKMDYMPTCAWQIVATGPLVVTGYCGFTAKNALESS